MMPDICMCEDKECPTKDKCYRFLAIPDEYLQSYFTESPRDKETGECGYFISTEKRRIREKPED